MSDALRPLGSDPAGPDPPRTSEEPALPSTSWWVRLLGGTPVVLVAAMVAYVALLSYASWIRFANFGAGAFDLGINVQALATAIGGVPRDRPDFMLFNGALGSDYLGIHFSPIFYVLSPAARLVPAAPFLFVSQWTALALGAPLVFRIARDRGVQPRSALLLSLAYLAYPPTAMAGAYDVHLLAFVPLIELLLYAGLVRRSVAVTAVALALAIAVQVLVDACPSARVLLDPRNWGRPQWSAVGAAGVAGGLFVVAEASMQAIAPGRAGELFVTLGSSWSLANVPLDLSVKLAYWLGVLGFVGFLPFLGWRRGLALLPSVALSFGSSDLNFSMLEWQYSFLLVPGVFLATIEAVHVLEHRLARKVGVGNDAIGTPPPGRARRARVARAAPVVVLAVILALGVLFAPLLPLARELPKSRSFTSLDPPENGSAFVALMAQIAPDAPLVASDYLFAHVAQDPAAYPLLVYLQGGVFGPLGHLPVGFTPQYFLLFTGDEGWAHVLYAAFPTDYELAGEVEVTPGSPLWPGEPPQPPETIALFTGASPSTA